MLDLNFSALVSAAAGQEHALVFIEGISLHRLLLQLAACANCAMVSGITLTLRREIKRAETVEHVDEKLGSRLAAKSSFKHRPRVLEPAQIVMVDELNAAVVPDTALKGLASERGLLIAAVLLAKKGLLPAIKLDRS